VCYNPHWFISTWLKVWVLSSGSRDQLCSLPAVLLWSWVFTVLIYWGFVSLPCPLSLGQGQWSISWPPAVSVLWWFADYFSILQCHLTLDVAPWLRRWALWTATCPILGSGLSPTWCRPFAFPAFAYWKFAWISNPYLSSFSGVLSATQSFCCVLVFSSLFIVQIFFYGGVCQSTQGLFWFIPEVAGGIPHDTRCSPVWSAECLPSMFGDGVWQRRQLSCFLSVMWYGEAFHGLGIQGVKVLTLLGAVFLPSVAPASQQGFGVTELTLSASVS
jgi:hypothetical protein